MSEIAFPKFGRLLCQNRPAIKDHILDEFGILFLLGLEFQSPTWTRRLKKRFVWNSQSF
jgi:hypothetical protein